MLMSIVISTFTAPTTGNTNLWLEAFPQRDWLWVGPFFLPRGDDQLVPDTVESVGRLTCSLDLPPRGFCMLMCVP